MYSWLVSPAGGEGSPTIFWQDIIDLTFIEATNDLHIQGQLVYLSGTPAILAGITVDGAVTILSADSTVNILAGFPVPGRMFYNSRFNQYLLFVDNQATPNQLTLVDTNLTVSNLDLSGVLPGNEVTFLASPGHIGEGVPSSCDPVFTILDGDTAALISAIESANGTPEPTPSAWRRAEPTPSQRHTGVPLLCPKSPATSPSKATTPPSPAMSLPPISASFRLRVQAR
jgi:hypothetical protein